MVCSDRSTPQTFSRVRDAFALNDMRAGLRNPLLLLRTSRVLLMAAYCWCSETSTSPGKKVLEGMQQTWSCDFSGGSGLDMS